MKEFLKKISASLQQRFGSGGAVHDVSPLAAHIDPNQLLPANDLLRLGTRYGGWIIPVDSGLDENSICYLAGAGEDISFDCALVERFGCHVRIIDPTPRAIRHFGQLVQALRDGGNFPINNSTTDFYCLTPEKVELLSFLPLGLADRDMELKFFLPRDPAHVSCSTVNLQKTEDFFTAQCHRLATVMEQQGDTRLDLLKMDIEGAEYTVIRDLVESDLLPRLLLIEFDEAHTPLDGNAGGRIGENIRQLVDAGMRCVAVEGSNATFVRNR